MKSAFISYSRSDERFARDLSNSLREVGFSAWVAAEQVLTSEPIHDTIRDAILNADTAFIILGIGGLSDWTRYESSLLLEAHWSNELELFAVVHEKVQPPAYLREASIIRAGAWSTDSSRACAEVIQALRVRDLTSADDSGVLENFARRTREIEKFANDQKEDAGQLHKRYFEIRNRLAHMSHEDLSSRQRAELYQRQAMLSLELGEYEQALFSIVQAEELFEDAGSQQHHAEVFYYRGLALFELERFQESVDAFRRAAELLNRSNEIESPLGGAILFNLGRAFFAIDEPEASKTAFDQAVRIGEVTLGPHHPAVDAYRRRAELAEGK